jgi:hypothetical protein
VKKSLPETRALDREKFTGWRRGNIISVHGGLLSPSVPAAPKYRYSVTTGIAQVVV